MANSGWSWQLFSAPVLWIGWLRKTPVISKSIAFEKAKQLIKSDKYLWEDERALRLHPNYKKPIGDVVYINADGIKLAYKFDIYALEPLERKHVYIDAINGSVLLSLNQIFETHIQGSSQSLYNGTVTFGAEEYDI